MAFVGAVVAFPIIARWMNPIHEYRLVDKCRSNMQQIGQGATLYAYSHAGNLPDDLETILANEDLDSAAFVCPATSDTPAPTAPTTQATAAGLRQPGHCSYIYVGKGLTTETATADTVLLYEPPANHGGGMNVLFGDLRVEFLSAADAQTILQQVAARKTPVRVPATAPAIEPAAGRAN